MATLVQFIKDRLDEDEALAKAATPGRWFATTEEVGWDFLDYTVEASRDEQVSISRGDQYGQVNSQHIARHSPERVLQDIAAKRELLDRVNPYGDDYNGWADEMVDGLLHLLAAPYAGHRDFNEDWIVEKPWGAR